MTDVHFEFCCVRYFLIPRDAVGAASGLSDPNCFAPALHSCRSIWPFPSVSASLRNFFIFLTLTEALASFNNLLDAKYAGTPSTVQYRRASHSYSLWGVGLCPLRIELKKLCVQSPHMSKASGIWAESERLLTDCSRSCLTFM